MGKIDVRRKAPNVFHDERDIKTPGVLDASTIRDLLRKAGDSPDFGGHYIRPGDNHWYDDFDDGPFDPNARECGFHDFDDVTKLPEHYFNSDFLICGMERNSNIERVTICDFNESYNNDFSTCKERCKIRKIR